MKTLFTFLLVLSISTVFGQTKIDFTDCLELIFSDAKFEPGLTSSMDVNGALIIVAENRMLNRNNTLVVQQILNSLVQDDFYDSSYNVKVVNGDLESQGIRENSILQINVVGDESNILFRISTVVALESTEYMWSYNLHKVDGEWEISGSSVDKRRAVVREW